MTREFVQVRPANGFLIHAVDANQEGSGRMFQYSMTRPICGKVQVRDAQRLPNLLFQKNAERLRKPFTGTMLQTTTKPVCLKCAERVAQISG